jgi:tight adherence protein B
MSGTTLIVAAVAGGLTLIILAVAVISMRRQNADIVTERLGRYTTDVVVPPTAEEKRLAKEKEKKSSKKTSGPVIQRLDATLENRKFADKWKVELARADLKLTVGEYFLVHIGAMIVIGAVGYLIFSGIVTGLVGAAIGFFVPRIYVSNRKGGRLRKFENQLPDILGLWVNSLRSGYSTMQSLEAISREAPKPSSDEFKRVIREVQLGIPQEVALAHLLERMPSEDLDLINTAVNIQREVGGNLAEILEVISHTIRERIKLKGEVRVLTAQGRITGYVIGGLPIALGLFLLVVNPTYMGRMFENKLCGWPMIAVGLGLIGAGTAVIQRIVDIKI